MAENYTHAAFVNLLKMLLSGMLCALISALTNGEIWQLCADCIAMISSFELDFRFTSLLSSIDAYF